MSFKASDGNRTRDLLTTNEVRYRLCHASKLYPLMVYIVPFFSVFVNMVFAIFTIFYIFC